ILNVDSGISFAQDMQFFSGRLLELERLDILNLFFQLSDFLQHLHSFPTRRSSDLKLSRTASMGAERFSLYFAESCSREPLIRRRSEEHTSELQSPYDLVCRLLLEKKNR